MKKISELFERYVMDFKKSPIIHVEETETGLSIKFDDIFYKKMEEEKCLDEVQPFIDKMLRDFINKTSQTQKN
jgi:hypothetical protein